MHIRVDCFFIPFNDVRKGTKINFKNTRVTNLSTWNGMDHIYINISTQFVTSYAALVSTTTWLTVSLWWRYRRADRTGAATLLFIYAERVARVSSLSALNDRGVQSTNLHFDCSFLALPTCAIEQDGWAGQTNRDKQTNESTHRREPENRQVFENSTASQVSYYSFTIYTSISHIYHLISTRYNANG